MVSLQDRGACLYVCVYLGSMCLIGQVGHLLSSGGLHGGGPQPLRGLHCLPKSLHSCLPGTLLQSMRSPFCTRGTMAAITGTSHLGQEKAIATPWSPCSLREQSLPQIPPMVPSQHRFFLSTNHASLPVTKLPAISSPLQQTWAQAKQSKKLHRHRTVNHVSMSAVCVAAHRTDHC